MQILVNVPDANRNTNIRWYIAINQNARRWTEKTCKANGDAGFVDFFILGDTGYWWAGGIEPTSCYAAPVLNVDGNLVGTIFTNTPKNTPTLDFLAVWDGGSIPKTSMRPVLPAV